MPDINIGGGPGGGGAIGGGPDGGDAIIGCGAPGAKWDGGGGIETLFLGLNGVWPASASTWS